MYRFAVLCVLLSWALVGVAEDGVRERQGDDHGGVTYQFENVSPQGEAEYMIGAAESAIAQGVRLGVDVQGAQGLLKNATDAAKNSNYAQAAEAANQALLSAQAALDRFYLDEAKRLVAAFDDQSSKLDDVARTELARIRNAIDAGEGMWAYSRAKELQLRVDRGGSI